MWRERSWPHIELGNVGDCPRPSSDAGGSRPPMTTKLKRRVPSPCSNPSGRSASFEGEPGTRRRISVAVLDVFKSPAQNGAQFIAARSKEWVAPVGQHQVVVRSCAPAGQG